ncbi:unnamed protein product [Rotaria sp. Silwood1]|nr:unnamed protein product [Rotaria sp. Silwood1]
MSYKSLFYNDCCLLINVDLNSQRIRQLLERRFKSISNKTSFDFKSLPPEQPSNNAKVSRSFLRYQPKLKPIHDDEQNISTDSSSSEEEDNDDALSTNDDDYLNKLAEWEPENFQPVIDDDDDEDENENENIIQSTSKENNNEDNEINQMDYSTVEDSSTTHAEDLLVTFIHRPLKTEPISFDNNIFHYPPQLDGQIDFSSTKSSTESNQTTSGKNLDDIIAKVKAKTRIPNCAIQIHKVPPPINKCRSYEDVKKKPISPTIKTKSLQLVPKSNRTKEQTKTIIPPLLTMVLKNNEDTIRPLETRISSIQTNIQKPSRRSSNNNLQSTISKKQNQKRNLSNEEHRFSQHRIKSSSINNKQKYILQTQTSKEKSAFVHMTLAEQKLNSFQNHQQLKTSTSKTLNSNSITSTTTTKSKEYMKIPSKPLRPIDSPIRNSESTTAVLNDHNQQIKKKPKKIKRLDTKKTNLSLNNKLQTKIIKQKSKEHKVLQKSKLNSHESEPSIHTTNSIDTVNKRPENFFHNCIVIDDDELEEYNNNHADDDDDDIQEIEQQQYSISYDIRTREKLLDHAVHSSLMHTKWLFNLEYLLLEHILICHEKHIHPLNKTYENSSIIKYEYPINSSSYNIDPSFISIIMINFIKMFILRNSINDQQEFSFIQFGITSHIRYLLIELPTYNHNDEKDLNDNCSKCHQYSLIINILFDLLFDLIEYDLCEIISKIKYRSSLIEDDYFTRFLQSNITKTNSYYRIKLIIYFIELIGIHMNKCQNKKRFQFNQNEDKLFQSIENFIRHIISQNSNSTDEKISICFNVMELCLLFVNEKEIRIKQMAFFLSELCQENSNYLNVFLFDNNLLSDIRLLLINELILKKFNLKFISINYINEFFRQIQVK